LSTAADMGKPPASRGQGKPASRGEGKNATRRERKKERTRREIYEAAMGLFTEKDYDAVTIGDICERADVAKATFFLHFPNKAALLSEFNEKLTQILMDQLENFEGTATEKFHFVVNELANERRNNEHVMRKMTREFIDGAPTLEQGQAATNSVWALITKLIRDGQKSGEFRKIAPAYRMAAAFVAASSALTLEWTHLPDADKSQSHKELLDLFLNGLTAGPEDGKQA